MQTHAHETDLFQPVRLGAYTLANRIVMAPLTRSRASADGVPTALMTQHYVQRASAGLIIAEGTNVSPQARGYANTPGLYDDAQIKGWQAITQAIHHEGGRIFVQLWHVGRISHPSLQPGGALPVAPSALRPQTRALTQSGYQACVTPRAVLLHEIPELIEQYRRAASNALAAGFDGVEIHAANGYLLEQFLRDSTNRRTDSYGGSCQNRARLLLEVTEAVVGACGAHRTGVRLSPLSNVNDCALDGDPETTYDHVARELGHLRVAYIHVIEGITQGPRQVPLGFDLHGLARSAAHCTYMANNGYDLERALEARRLQRADLISFGRLYIANPDLVERLRTGAPLNTPDAASFFGGGAHGYTDYPRLHTLAANPR